MTPISTLASLMGSGEFSDLRFLCNGEEFSVHKAVVCTQSSVIKAAVRGGFNESQTNVITMDAFHPSSVKRFVQFMYTGDYDEPIDEDEAAPADDDATLEEWLDEQDRADNHTERGGTVATRTTDILPGWFNADTGGYSYTEVVSDEPNTPQPENPPATELLLGHIRLNSIGDYYNVDSLVHLANTKIRTCSRARAMTTGWRASRPQSHWQRSRPETSRS